MIRQMAAQLNLPEKHVRSVVDLFEAGNTIPFIARYRKEVTAGMDEVALRAVDDLLAKLRDLAARKATVLKSIDEQGLLTKELRQQIDACQDKASLEHLYQPFRPKRRTRATVARDRGLQPLADVLLAQQPLPGRRRDLLESYVNAENNLPDVAAVLQGACDIVAESWAEDPAARQWLSDQAFEYGKLASKAKRGKKEAAGEKYEMYLDHAEAVQRIPAHRLLAMMRGQSEGLLNVGLKLNDELVLRKLGQRWLTNPRFEFASELRETVADCYHRLLLPAIETVVLQQLKERADVDAIGVFVKNLRELLLAAPAGPRVTLGVDPGFRTGCKLAVVGQTGDFLESATIYPTPPRKDTDNAARIMLDLIRRHDVELIAIGNGTASRETDAFVTDVLKREMGDRRIEKVVVSESGASVYSASELAGREYPDLDVTVRGAISIAHRLQDPLAELVKIDPKSIGVGQYQHDVNQTALQKSLNREVESCVNLVGVDVNMASSALLSHVAGIGPKLAEGIVRFRNEHGPFSRRDDLKKVPKLGAKAFQQSAGFLRVRGGTEPLDNSAVHPESYYVVRQMAKRLSAEPSQLVGNAALSKQLVPAEFVDEQVGLPTVADIISELAKPGRDPRSEFRVVKFAEGIHEIGDLKTGMILEGVISNVTPFGAFIDLGVHQDGLIHISQLANEFVKDPNDVVKVGDVVRVKVLEVDLERRRISVSRKEVA